MNYQTLAKKRPKTSKTCETQQKIENIYVSKNYVPKENVLNTFSNDTPECSKVLPQRFLHSLLFNDRYKKKGQIPSKCSCMPLYNDHGTLLVHLA